MIIVVWWIGVDYGIICATLCTCSDLLVGYTLSGNILTIFLIHTILHTNPWVVAAVHTLRKKVVSTAFLVVIHQTIGKHIFWITLLWKSGGAAKRSQKEMSH